MVKIIMIFRLHNLLLYFLNSHVYLYKRSLLRKINVIVEFLDNNILHDLARRVRYVKILEHNVEFGVLLLLYAGQFL